MKLAAHAVDVYERKCARVRAVRQEYENALVLRIDPAAGAGEASVTKTIGRQIGARR